MNRTSQPSIPILILELIVVALPILYALYGLLFGVLLGATGKSDFFGQMSSQLVVLVSPFLAIASLEFIRRIFTPRLPYEDGFVKWFLATGLGLFIIFGIPAAIGFGVGTLFEILIGG